MKPITSSSPAVGEYPRPEKGSLCFHEDTPEVVFICTKPATSYIGGVIVHSPSPNDLGTTIEYGISKIKLLNGTLTLKQIW